MKVRIPQVVVDDLEELIPVYVHAREKVTHGSIDLGGVILSWDATGAVYLESIGLEEVKE